EPLEVILDVQAPALKLRLLKLVGLIKELGEKITFPVQTELTFARRKHRSRRRTELRIATSSTAAGWPYSQEARVPFCQGRGPRTSRRAPEDTSCKSQARERFDTLAAGVPLSNAERSSLLRALPLVATLFGEDPAIDEQLPRDSDRAIL
ncbi:hypothetical protein TELCIR_23965, partial [Teladorsagia circumcincta]